MFLILIALSSFLYLCTKKKIYMNDNCALKLMFLSLYIRKLWIKLYLYTSIQDRSQTVTVVTSNRMMKLSIPSYLFSPPKKKIETEYKKRKNSKLGHILWFTLRNTKMMRNSLNIYICILLFLDYTILQREKL